MNVFMKNFLRSFYYAINGIRLSVLQQRNLKVQLAIALVTFSAGLYFDITLIEWCIILIASSLVIGLEIVNTAIENLVDLVTTEWKPLAGKVKDMAAGAVLTASVFSLVVGVIVFKKYCVAITLASGKYHDTLVQVFTNQ
jgi:diacylglycerol kinase